MSDKSGVKKQKKSTKKSAKKSEKATETKQKPKTVKKVTKASKGSVKSPKAEKTSKASKSTNNGSKKSVKSKVVGIADGVYMAIELDQKDLIQKFHSVTITNEGKGAETVLKLEILDQTLTVNSSEINDSDKPTIEVLSDKISKSIKIPIVLVLDPSDKVNIPKFEPFFLKDLFDKGSPYGYGSNFGNFDDQEIEEDTESQTVDLIRSLNENIVEAFDNQFSYRI